MSLEDILEYNPERHVKFNIEFDEWRRYPQIPDTPTNFFLLKAPLAPCLSWLYHITHTNARGHLYHTENEGGACNSGMINKSRQRHRIKTRRLPSLTDRPLGPLPSVPVCHFRLRPRLRASSGSRPSTRYCVGCGPWCASLVLC